MSEIFRPKTLIAITGLGAVAIFGGGELIDYYASRAGEEMGNQFVETVEQSDVGQQKVAELKQLLRDEFTAEWLADQLQQEGIDGQWLIETVAQNDS